MEMIILFGVVMLLHTVEPPPHTHTPFRRYVYVYLLLIFGPTGGAQNGSQDGQKPSFSDLAEILHPEQFLGPEFENEVRF